MKVLSKQKLVGNNYIKYALTERNVLSHSQHPFIVQLNYAFQSKNHLYMILEYCPGGDLGKLLMKKGKLTEEVARIYIAEVLLAIQYLHKKEIIFRDLKPDNIVIDFQGHCKLTDFGLSKEGIDDNISAQSFCGSLAYLAPEMLARQGHGKSVDWYLLGVLLYEMLVGKTPYFSRDKEQLLKNIENAELYFPRDLSNKAKLLILQLMDRDPQSRLGSSPRDAEDIKDHAFFKSLDWSKVERREYELPAPQIKRFETTLDFTRSIFKELDSVPTRPAEVSGKNPKQNFNDYGSSSFLKNNIPGWSFKCD